MRPLRRGGRPASRKRGVSRLSQSVLTQLREGMRGFSKGQKRIAAYVIEHYDKAAFMTAAALGDAVGVSESTVVRFAGELGFDGYPHLQRNLQELIRSRLTTLQRLDLADGPVDGRHVLSQVMTMDADRLHRTLSEIPQQDFDAAVEALVSARRIYILGVRSSQTLAGFLFFYFNHIFDNVVDLSATANSEVFEQMIHMEGGDLLVAFSFPRYSQRTIRAAAYAKSCGARIIGITDSRTSPLALQADLVLPAQSEMASFVDSLVAPLSLLNAIIVAVGLRRRDDVTESYRKLESIWSEYDVYEKAADDDGNA